MPGLKLLHVHNGAPRLLTTAGRKVRNGNSVRFVFFKCFKPTNIQYGMEYTVFLHDRPWISAWIKSISNELDITIHVIASQLSCHCDVISNRLWRHQQNENRASETLGRCEKIVSFIVIYEFVMSCKNNFMYVLPWRTVSALTRVLFW